MMGNGKRCDEIDKIKDLETVYVLVVSAGCTYIPLFPPLAPSPVD